VTLFSIDPEKCNRDGLCAAVCPVGCIVFGRGALPVPHEKKYTYCLSCGHCLAVCPSEAIVLDRFKVGGIQGKPSLAVSFEQAEQFLKMRRSVRAFRDEPIERVALERLLKITEYAPSGHNLRPTRWAVAGTKEKVRAVASEIAEWMREQADRKTPLAETLHLSGIVRAWDDGVDLICRNAPALAVAYGPDSGVTPREDGVIALTYLELAASAAGLGACWCGYALAVAAYESSLCEMFGIPADHAVYGVLMLGKPVRKYTSIPPRPAPRIHWL